MELLESGFLLRECCRVEFLVVDLVEELFGCGVGEQSLSSRVDERMVYTMSAEACKWLAIISR